MFKKFREGLSRNVVFLGIVSGLTDISSEMIYPLVPIFLTSVLNAPMAVVGMMEGAAEATASLLKAGVGYWSDRTGKRKPFIVWGYGLSAVSKPLIGLAFAWPMVLFARIVDRIGKGVRTSARDALISSCTPKEHWGKAFGFHRAMDTAGAAIGPLVAIFLLEVVHMDYRPVFFLAFIPALFGVLVLMTLVRETPAEPRPAGEKRPGFLETFRAMPSSYKRFLVFAGVFYLGNSSDIFLIMRAKSLGMSTSTVIFAYVGYNIIYALCATPAGWLADRLGKTRTMITGLLVFSAVYAGFAMATEQWMIWPLFAVYGFYGAMTEGVAKALISEYSLPHMRGSAMGLFNAMIGLLAFAASSLAGILWSAVSPAACFILGAACALISAAMLSTLKTARQS